ncbi:MAG: thiamine biosynthesis protein ApbE [Bacteroidetes bacterium HGW-Bacteroidetes-12]|nr:MAG: thiamine biosynthesis protein ApbE [Bacteroidetes bacterium HGW-Bacteroidetes-12]
MLQNFASKKQKNKFVKFPEKLNPLSIQRIFIVVVALFFTTNLLSQEAEKFAYKQVLKLMGTRFEITAVSADEQLAKNSIDSCIKEIQRIEDLISSWKPTTQTSLINDNAGIQPVKVDRELIGLILRSKKISELTGGAFDISFASVTNLWKFDGTQNTLPTEEELAKSVAKINYKNIIVDEQNQTVFLKEKGMKIGFGAIGKGYAANMGRKKMIELGIKDGIVNASGDLITWGKMENNSDWSIGIENPKETGKVMGWLVISNMAVVTSGNYEKFFMFEGKKYSHIINPTTGWPATGSKSVTIICADAEIADALATSVFILGPEKGVELINKLKNIECLIVTDADELVTSSGIKLNYYENKATKQTTNNQLIINNNQK